MTLTDLIKDRSAHFVYYRDGQFIYEIREQDIVTHDMFTGIKTTHLPGFKFPVPLNDIGTAMLKSDDKAIIFMRWIRQQLDLQQQSEVLDLYVDASLTLAEELGIK